MRNGLAGALRAHEVDVMTVAEARMLGQTDEAQLLWAASQQRVLYSFNGRDFGALHRRWISSGQQHYGIVLAPQQRYSIGDQLRRLLRLLHTRTADDMRNRLEYLSAWKP